MAERKPYLTRRDRLLLSFVARYRAATEEMLRYVLRRQPGGRGSPHRLVRRLVRRGLLQQFPLRPGHNYLVLTRRGFVAIGWSPRPSRPFTEQSLPVVLAVGWYCLRTGVSRLTEQEFQERYPELWKSGLRSSAYFLVESPSGLKLGLFVVDRGATPRRIQGKLRRLISQRAELPAFAALINAKRFRITVLTGLPAQQQNIRRHLRRPYFHRVEIDVTLIPELGELLTLR